MSGAREFRWRQVIAEPAPLEATAGNSSEVKRAERALCRKRVRGVCLLIIKQTCRFYFSLKFAIRFHKIFNMHPSRITRKPQARTEATKAKILDAAQSLFAESGFENTQLDEVAARAGCSRGGIYAHYTSKEDLFLALMEHRVSATFRATCKKIAAEPDLKERRNIFKQWLVQQVCGPESGTLTLEFKLYAVRRPEKRDELLALYNALFSGTDGLSIELLFGEKLTKAARTALEQRLAVLSGALNGFILERHFRPALLAPSHLQPLAEEIFDALLHT